MRPARPPRILKGLLALLLLPAGLGRRPAAAAPPARASGW